MPFLLKDAKLRFPGPLAVAPGGLQGLRTPLARRTNVGPLYGWRDYEAIRLDMIK